ncbi:LTA synthase family protein [Pseudoalteromonas denitrificans]|uniref:Phosphoglycerol transferase MdoB n=1 Tax=Pseudoalteromonas denitrificans DSM 6059 TaxID=1123010 RepID=A0A1I1EQ45_9GAMM|nr:LTA synthase family protein [Pseudoalteromonas denitrificans]SFB87003.1 Phosphoglycerol transferase MdoB [Pseudoalteromonas denitrificans DSM 6059]
MEVKSQWHNYFSEMSKILTIWLSGVLFLGSFRIILFFTFQDQVNEQTSWFEYLQAMQTGFKFDSAAVGIFLAIPFLANMLLQPFGHKNLVNWLTIKFSYVFYIITSALCVISISYFAEYNSLFNYFLFEGLYDDQLAVAKTIWGQYHPITSFFVFVLLIYGSHKLLTNINRSIEAPFYLSKLNSTSTKIIVSTLIFLSFVAAARGSLESRPAMRKWASVTSDPFLNKIIINPNRSLMYAYKDFKKVSGNSNINPYIKENEFEESLKHTFSTDSNNKHISDYLQKSAHGAAIDKPEHIFLIIMESYDSWPLQEKYTELHITDGLRKIAKQGVNFKRFLPAASSTMNSLASIISGIPYSGVNMSRIGAVGPASSTSIFKQFQALGYETNFYYGGLLSWQNIGSYVKNQGASHVYSAANAGGKGSAGAWGIDDDQLFNFIAKNTNTTKPSFNIILTTSYHGPFNLDLESKGYHFKNNQDYPQNLQQENALSANTLGHLWFSDLAMSNFIENQKIKTPKSLFAITGDHYGRRYFNAKPNLLELSSVPFVLSGMNVNSVKFNENHIGNHLDIAPTIIELIAKKDFQYSSIGKAMQLKQGNEIAIGYQKALNKEKVWSIIPDVNLNSWDGHKQKNLVWPQAIKQNPELTSKYRHYMGVSWNMLMHKEITN